MKRFLITGCGGYVGSYLAEFLLERGAQVSGTVHRNTDNLRHLRERLDLRQCDVLDRKRVEEVVAEVRPEGIFHLAAQSLITRSWQHPEEALQVNVLGTLYLLEAVRGAGINPVVEVVGSSSEYGFTRPEETPIPEDRQLRPSSPYGVSKVAQDLTAYLYWRIYGMRVVRVRPFALIGPRKSLDACSDFARGIVQVERGEGDLLEVGNLEAVRDLVDVRDGVRAMYLIAEEGVPGEVYNLCSGKGHTMGEVLETMLSLSTKHVEVRQQPAKLRTFDDPVFIGDNAKLRALGWKPRIPLRKTLADVLDYWRQRGP